MVYLLFTMCTLHKNPYYINVHFLCIFISGEVNTTIFKYILNTIYILNFIKYVQIDNTNNSLFFHSNKMHANSTLFTTIIYHFEGILKVNFIVYSIV